MPRCDACHTTAVGKYGTLIWKSCSGYKLYTPVWGWSWMDWTVWMVFFLQCGMSQGFSNGSTFGSFQRSSACMLKWCSVFVCDVWRIAYAYLYVFVLDIPFTVPFLGGFPIRGSKLNLVGEFIRGRNANLQSFIWHVTFTAHQAFGGVHAFFAALRFPERIFKGDPCRQRNSAFVCSMEQKCPRAHSIL